MQNIQITRIAADDLPRALPGLADTLLACVADGASVGFIQPFDRRAATAFWRDRVFPGVIAGGTTIFAAWRDGAVVGTVQLGTDLMPNQPHRADVAKMLVHPRARRTGIARALMQRLEAEARARHKTLLVLDTRSGDPAQKLYAGLGFEVAGEISGYCRHPSEDRFEATTYMYKALT